MTELTKVPLSERPGSVAAIGDRYPEEFARIDYARRTFAWATRLRGYERIENTPLEDVAFLSRLFGTSIEEDLHVLDRSGGTALRFDATLPAARMVIAAQDRLPEIVRWSSMLESFRRELPGEDHQPCFRQWNCELYGASGPSADAEVIDTLFDALTSVGLRSRDFDIRISHRALMVEVLTELAGDSWPRVRQLLDQRAAIEPPELRARLAGLGLGTRSIHRVLAVAELRGDEGLTQVERLVGSPPAREAVLHLRRVLASLEGHARFDMAVCRSDVYYTGLMVECTSVVDGVALAGGGRYDDMIARLGGADRPACGFAIGEERVVTRLERSVAATDPDAAVMLATSVLGGAGATWGAIAAELRRAGIVCELELDAPSMRTRAGRGPLPRWRIEAIERPRCRVLDSTTGATREMTMAELLRTIDEARSDERRNR